MSRSSIKMCMCIEGADSWACCGRGIGFDPQVGERAADKSWETISTLSAIKKPSTLKSSLLLGRDNLSTFARQLVPWRGKAAGSPVRGSERERDTKQGRRLRRFSFLSLYLFSLLCTSCVFVFLVFFPFFRLKKTRRAHSRLHPFFTAQRAGRALGTEKPRPRLKNQGHAPRGEALPAELGGDRVPATPQPRPRLLRPIRAVPAFVGNAGAARVPRSLLQRGTYLRRTRLTDQGMPPPAGGDAARRDFDAALDSGIVGAPQSLQKRSCSRENRNIKMIFVRKRSVFLSYLFLCFEEMWAGR